METIVTFGRAENIKVTVAQKKVEEQVEFIVKLSCDVPLNIESIARLVNMAHADVPISCTFSSNQMMFDLSVATIDDPIKSRRDKEPATVGG